MTTDYPMSLVLITIPPVDLTQRPGKTNAQVGLVVKNPVLRATPERLLDLVVILFHLKVRKATDSLRAVNQPSTQSWKHMELQLAPTRCALNQVPEIIIPQSQAPSRKQATAFPVSTINLLKALTARGLPLAPATTTIALISTIGLWQDLKSTRTDVTVISWGQLWVAIHHLETMRSPDSPPKTTFPNTVSASRQETKLCQEGHPVPGPMASSTRLEMIMTST